MESMLQSGYQSVLEAGTREALHAELLRFTRHLGFETFGAIAVKDHFLGESEFVNIDNTPAAYRPLFEDYNNARRDPVIQHCKIKSLPIVWNQSTYTSAGCGDMWEKQARFGYRHGISLALHMPQGRHLVLGVDRDQALPKDPIEVTRMVASLQLFAVHVQEVVARILIPATSSEPCSPQLTPRELETLHWTMEGKTAWEIGRILGIAENTVIRHIHSAAKKLDCSNKHQAVLKALRLKLIR